MAPESAEDLTGALGGDADAQIDAFTSGKSIPVKVGAIEKELSRLWRLASERAQKTATREEGVMRLAVTRACLWNLVLRTESPGDLPHIKQLVDELSPTLPARVLVMSPDLTATEAKLTAWVEANLRTGRGGEREIFAEEVTIEAAGAAAQHLPSLVRELILPDVPTAMYWPGEPPEESMPLSGALSLMDRLIIDTDEMWSQTALADLVKLVHTYPQMDVSDLGWIRMNPLRLAIAAFFDPPNAARVREIRRIDLECARHREPAGLLFLGWLAAQLHLGMGHKVSGDGGANTLVMTRRGAHAGEVILSLKATDAQPDHEIGGLTAVRLTLAEGEFAVRAGGKADDEQEVEVATPGLRHIDHHPVRTEVELLNLALGAHGLDGLYQRALSRASEMASALRLSATR
jgi:glucose-6-phosphate dehydrogenase assembly protein OpcA